ncbi:hypothetical protein SUGI_1027330 [Cryptomeria japonica]|nr:hypothetical protein SUGI_1027330 [Cryptomeria japonica]
MGRKSSGFDVHRVPGFDVHRELVIKVGSGKNYRKLNKGEKISETVKDNKSLTRKFVSKLHLGLHGSGTSVKEYVEYLKIAVAKGGPGFSPQPPRMNSFME